MVNKEKYFFGGGRVFFVRLALLLGIGLFVGCGNRIPYFSDPPIPEKPEGGFIWENCADDTPCIGIVTHTTLNTTDWKVTQPNQRAYAKSHGHNFIFRNGNISRQYFNPENDNWVQKMGLYWQKIASVRSMLNEQKEDGDYRYAWVLWVDPDTVFTQPNKSVWDLIETVKKVNDADFSFSITRDEFIFAHDEVNAGVLLVKNDKFGRDLFLRIGDTYPWYKDTVTPEQNAIQDIIFGYIKYADDNMIREFVPLVERAYAFSELLPEVALVAPRTFNSIYGNSAASKSAVWQPGDYIAHFAGVGDRTVRIPRFLRCLDENGYTSLKCSDV